MLLRILIILLPLLSAAVGAQLPSSVQPLPETIFGFRDSALQASWDNRFLDIPDARLAGEHLRILTSAPHWASSPEDYATAVYVASKYKAAGISTEIIPYKVRFNKPVSILIEAFNADGKKILSGPTPEHVDAPPGLADPYQDDPRILPAFSGSSPSGDVTAEVVYANYGTLADFKQLATLGISVRGKIVLCRYGENFRGIKAYIAQQYGAVGVLIYSDPADDGFFKGDVYPKGPYRPDSAVQRGSVQFLPIYPGDPETPGIASTSDLPASKRLSPAQFQIDQPSIPVNPLSYKDAMPILQALGGQESPREWQGALPFTYHLGVQKPSLAAVTVHMKLVQDSQLRTIWDVIGTIPGSDPSQQKNWVVAGNHRDAWVFGAVDPNSGTAAMLETVHGLGELLKQGWKPKRTIILGSWDAEEEGLIGSTEWVEQHDRVLRDAVAYFNTDIAVAGPEFGAAAVPSLKDFVREVTRAVPSPAGGTVYDQWKLDQEDTHRRRSGRGGRPASAPDDEVHVGDLGSGSDYTPFLQHVGVPSTDIGSAGPYGVYHSAFDNYNWFLKFADPTFVYEQQQARVFGLEILHMADADVLPYDDATYGQEIVTYLDTAEDRATKAKLSLDFTPAEGAARRFAAAGAAIRAMQVSPPADASALNTALRAAEAALLNPIGLPRRPWYKHTIYAPGEYTGYVAVVIPGVNEGIDAADAPRTQGQLKALTDALNRAAQILESAKR